MACLAFAAYAAGGHPSLAGLTVAYAAARAVGSIPLMPGGLLVVEAVLVPGLVSSGMTLPDAISAMLIYRLVSWIFISAIGWVMFFFMFRTESQVDPDLMERADAGVHGRAPSTTLKPRPILPTPRCRGRFPRPEPESTAIAAVTGIPDRRTPLPSVIGSAHAHRRSCRPRSLDAVTTDRRVLVVVDILEEHHRDTGAATDGHPADRLRR